jgi:repressor LexA
MKTSLITPRQKQLLQIIYDWLKTEGNIPSFEEMKNELGVNSNQAVLDLLEKLEEKKMIKRNEGLARSINILQKGYESLEVTPLVNVVGLGSCGPLVELFEQKDVWVELSPEVHQFSGDFIIIRAFGDSMIGAGIIDGDLLLFTKAKEFKDNEIVLARTMDGTTVKRLINRDKKTYFQPENPKYERIPITEETYILGKLIKNLSRNYA